MLLAAPPLLSSADTAAIIQLPAGAILVARAGRDDVSEIAAAVRELERCAPPVVGAVFCESSWSKADGEFEIDSEIDHNRHPSAQSSLIMDGSASDSTVRMDDRFWLDQTSTALRHLCGNLTEYRPAASCQRS